MNRLLHIDASIFQTPSVTRQLTADIVRKLLAKYPAAQATYRDVVAEEIRPLNAAIAAGFRAGNDDNVSEYIAEQHRLSDLLVAEFLASDVIVIGAPMYNFSMPAQLKSWLDRIAQAGKTFSYTAQGPVGLSGGRTVIVASARGGFYHGGSLEEWDFQERYLAAFFRFLGVEHIHVIRAEGASKGEAIQQREIGNAFNAASTLIQSLAL
ncbi:FMN-dependent NADH-azoreductase [Pantoea stewartii]|uniref:FMN-dependent NADH-azoreductase n=1 Tax=Pantoea stewartii TaxID=66269 RepID=UPI00249EB631|nr:NAD(P)H-dependent oxidoreductase [Pantoea stewartii]